MKEIIFKTLFKKETSAALLSRSGISSSSSDIFILGMYMYIAGLTWKKAENLNFDVFLIIWIKYFRLGDAILDEYPDIVDIYTIKDNISLSIKQDNFPVISLGVLEDKKRSQDSVIKYLSLVNKLNGNNSIVQNIRLDTDEQYLINHVFSEASRAMLESFLLEKQYGVLANSVKARQIFDAKTMGYLDILSRLYPVLHQSAVGWEKNIATYNKDIF